MLVSGLLALGLGVTAVSLPVPYVVESPGPTFNTLGNDNGKPVISVTGHETFPGEGQPGPHHRLRRRRPQRAGDASSRRFPPGSTAPKAVYPEELVFPTGVTKEQSQQESAVAMTTSQENAVASALKELGIAFEQKMQVAGIPEGSASAGKLQENDVLVVRQRQAGDRAERRPGRTGRRKRCPGGCRRRPRRQQRDAPASRRPRPKPGGSSSGSCCSTSSSSPSTSRSPWRRSAVPAPE